MKVTRSFAIGPTITHCPVLRVVNFAQNSSPSGARSRRGDASGGKSWQFPRPMDPKVPDQEYRAIQREMAAEWLKLADALIHPLGPMKSK